jgi:trehalose 6-phosphate synthase
VDAAAVVIASNRGPIGFQRADDGSVVGARGGGGLVSAMSGLSNDGATVWVCAALGDIDFEIAAAAPAGRIDLAGHPEAGAVAMLAIDRRTLDGAYNAIANTTLWFLHHEMTDVPQVYDQVWRADWMSYIAYNAAFAEAIGTAAADGARVLVQDYHLALVPALLRARRPDLRIGHFTHTPWASPAVFTTLPHDVTAEILLGMLGSDSVGFHSARWAKAFVGCCVDVLGAEDLGGAVRYDDRVTAVRIHPLGVDAGPLRARAAEPDVAQRRAELSAQIGDRQVIARVDRTEPSKNIGRGIEAFRDLLTRYPEHRDRVMHVALAYPSRQDVTVYREYTESLETLAHQVNEEFGSTSWTPMLLSVRDDYPLSLGTLQSADVLFINPVRDGMNLVAKEGVLLTDDAVLVLSAEAGAADEMGEAALLVDPLDIAGTANALHAALQMPADERARRHASLLSAATALPPAAWLRQQLDALHDQDHF